MLTRANELLEAPWGKPKGRLVLVIIPLFAIIGTAFGFTRLQKNQTSTENQIHNTNIEMTDDLLLKEYPISRQPRKSDRTTLRNPFSPPRNLGAAQVLMPAPSISIKGFGGSQSAPTVFLSINNSYDDIYSIGREVGSGFRISSIQPKNNKIIISDGTSRFEYTLKDY